MNTANCSLPTAHCPADCQLPTAHCFQLPPDGWYQLAPLGEFAHAASELVQVVDAEACEAMAQRFAAEAAGANFAGLLIDFDHFSLDAGSRSEAAGWITALEARDSGLWGKIRWSDLGEAAVSGGRYRFLSPVWSRSDCVELGDNRVRPVRLLNAAVTNDPNLRGMRPLSNNRARPEAHCPLPTARCPLPTELPTANRQLLTGTKRFRWVLGDPPEGRHCPSCAGLAGQVHTMAEWKQLGLVPGSGALFCRGHCHCALVETDEPETGDLAAVPARKPDPEKDDGKDDAKTPNRNVNACIDWEKACSRALRKNRSVDFLPRVEACMDAPVNGVTQPRRTLGMSNQGRKETPGTGGNGGTAEGAAPDLQTLANALRFEREKNQVLLDNLVRLEDDLVDRQLADFAPVVSEASRPFWREQLLCNRDAALSALEELSRSVSAGQAAGGGTVKRPLHNRETVRPSQRRGFVGEGAPVEVREAGLAARIRNRAQELCTAERIPFSAAFRRAEQEISGQSSVNSGQ